MTPSLLASLSPPVLSPPHPSKKTVCGWAWSLSDEDEVFHWWLERQPKWTRCPVIWFKFLPSCHLSNPFLKAEREWKGRTWGGEVVTWRRAKDPEWTSPLSMQHFPSFPASWTQTDTKKTCKKGHTLICLVSMKVMDVRFAVQCGEKSHKLGRHRLTLNKSLYLSKPQFPLL